SPANGAVAIPINTNVNATFTESVQSGTITFVLKDPANNTIPGTTSYNDINQTVTFTPTSSLLGSTTYTATLSGAKDANNNTMTTTNWSFTTVSSDTTPPTVTAQTPSPGA